MLYDREELCLRDAADLFFANDAFIGDLLFGDFSIGLQNQLNGFLQVLADLRQCRPLGICSGLEVAIKGVTGQEFSSPCRAE